MTSWLNRTRKQTLIDLSNEAGLTIDEDSRKDEIVEALDSHLQKNASRLSRNASFEPYYGTRRTPFKTRDSDGGAGATSGDDGEVKSVVRARGKKPTKIKQETQDDEMTIRSPTQAIAQVASAVSNSVAVRTPASSRQQRRRSQLPASPADVADEIEEVTTKVYAGIGDLYTLSGIPETIDWVRETCSSVVGVNATLMMFEAYGLQRTVMPWKYAFDVPAVPSIGLSSFAVKLPDLFVLLSWDFWGPSLLWSATSLFIPLLFAYFYNLTIQPVKKHGTQANVARYTYDPLTFNIVKALATLLVYGRAIPYELLDEGNPTHVVERAFIGGHGAVLIGCLIGGLSAIWEAAQL